MIKGTITQCDNCGITRIDPTNWTILHESEVRFGAYLQYKNKFHICDECFNQFVKNREKLRKGDQKCTNT